MDPFKTMSDEELHWSAIRAARLDRKLSSSLLPTSWKSSQDVSFPSLDFRRCSRMQCKDWGFQSLRLVSGSRP
jgi:hypothetical protein